MADWIYVDNSNVFIEGKRVSAVRRGLALDIQQAHDNRILDNDYRMSFGKLYAFVAGEDRRAVSRAMLFGSRPPAADAIWAMAERAGFELVVHDRNIANKEKKIDTGIVTEMSRDAYMNGKPGDVFTLVTGDRDYVPIVQRLVGDGYLVDIVFWNHAARELKEAASKFVSLDDQLDHLRP